MIVLLLVTEAPSAELTGIIGKVSDRDLGGPHEVVSRHVDRLLPQHHAQ